MEDIGLPECLIYAVVNPETMETINIITRNDTVVSCNIEKYIGKNISQVKPKGFIKYLIN